MGSEGKKRKLKVTSAADATIPDEEIAQLTHGLSKEQLCEIVKEAAILHQDVLSKLQKLADEDPADRKLFVRGLNFSTDKPSLQKAFEEYGSVEDCLVVVDKTTGKSKGFGFVTYQHRVDAIRALKEPSKTIDGRETICYLSGARNADAAAAGALAPASSLLPEVAASSRKIYVGNVPKNIEKDTLRSFFAQYGEISEGPLGFDSKTGKCKGYTLIVYKSHESVRKCLQDPIKTIDGHKVQCKLADSQKVKEEGVKPGPSTIGFDITNPAHIASHGSSFLQSGVLGRLPSDISSLHALDTLLPQTSSLLGRDSTYLGSSLPSIYGIPLTSSLSTSHHSLSSLQDTHSLGYLSSLHRNGLF
ncbi:hypothetical protein KP509_10G042100 [Ceratopteris richardii]|uniref:RRM domain-containing protein n=1 Tax=Ceratopteris richardii TaxID=49495 RepID=A0A8T2U0Q0_CERRI|nr:hypothetical protein KP509_10G042100 [Ceratopteris richardii]